MANVIPTDAMRTNDVGNVSKTVVGSGEGVDVGFGVDVGIGEGVGPNALVIVK
jgi:hypothetical protein